MNTQQIFANLNPESKYFEYQKQEQPFEVSLVPDRAGYHWKGGIGGQYRTVDLDFFIKQDDQFKSINLCNLGSIQQLVVTKNSLISPGGDWHSSNWERIIEHTSELLKEAKREYKKQIAREEKEDIDNY